MASEQEKQDFAVAIAAHVPEQMFQHHVREQAVVADLDDLVKRATGTGGQRLVAIAKAVIERYDEAHLLYRLADRLYAVMMWRNEFLLVAGPLATPPTAGNTEAFHARRDNLFLTSNLQQGLAEQLPRICCIVGRYDLAGEHHQPQGTGFLVGPDLVLTAMHVFEPLGLVNESAVPGAFMVYFDHVLGEPIRRPDDLRNGVRRVRLADKWLVAHRSSLVGDGTIDVATPEQDALMKQNLDFALIKLADEVGLETVEPWGGSKRSWVQLPAAPIAASLGVDGRIVIPQHASGEVRAIDFGRYRALCNSGTRIRYDTASAPGTSGAPCFGRDFGLVGVHNATFKVPGKEANQAIFFDAIAALVNPHLAGVNLPVNAPSLLWNISQDMDKPRPIIGRDNFLTWFLAAQSVDVPNRAARIYAATAPAPGSGKTFSVEVLNFGLKDKSGQRAVVLGTQQELIPSRLEDLVRVIGERLSVPAEEYQQMPIRPAADLPEASDDGDKLRRWASLLMPRWFADALERHRDVMIDKREAAKKLVKEHLDFGSTVPPELQKIADSTQPVIENVERWRLAWIVLDRLPQTTLSPDVKNFLAGMTGVGGDENALAPVLRRLRWMFLGYRPDFLTETDCCAETLDPTTVPASDVAVMLRSAYDAANRKPSPQWMETFSNLIADIAVVESDAGGDPAVRMRKVQAFAGRVLPRILPSEA